jgi:ribosomal protein S8
MRVGKPDIFFLNQFLKILVRARKAQIFRIEYRYHNSILQLLAILAKENFILSYGVAPDKITILLQQRNAGASLQIPFNKIDICSTARRYRSLSLKELKSLSQKDPFSLYIISTPVGLLSSQEALNRQTGGLLLARIGF